MVLAAAGVADAYDFDRRIAQRAAELAKALDFRLAAVDVIERRVVNVVDTERFACDFDGWLRGRAAQNDLDLRPLGANPGEVGSIDDLVGLVPVPDALGELSQHDFRRCLKMSKKGELRHALCCANRVRDEMLEPAPAKPVEP